MRKDSFYFPHDYNARNDVKCLFLRQQLGMEGFGIFWFLVESLAESGGILPLKIIPVLAMQMQVPDIKVSAVINSFELFQVNEDHFFSCRLNEHLEVRKTLSDKGKEGAALRWKNKEVNSLPISNPNAKERKGKEIKERKEKEINADKPLSLLLIKKEEKIELSSEDIIKSKKQSLYNLIKIYKDKNPDKYPVKIYNDFYKHWGEVSKNGKNIIRYDEQKFFEIGKRLATFWSRLSTEEKSKLWQLEKDKPKTTLLL